MRGIIGQRASRLFPTNNIPATTTATATAAADVVIKFSGRGGVAPGALHFIEFVSISRCSLGVIYRLNFLSPQIHAVFFVIRARISAAIQSSYLVLSRATNHP